MKLYLVCYKKIRDFVSFTEFYRVRFNLPEFHVDYLRFTKLMKFYWVYHQI